MEFWGTLYFQTSHLPIWVSKCSIFAMFLCAMPFWGTDFRGAGWVSWDEVWGLANFGDLRPEFWDPPHQVSKPNCHKTVASQVKRPWIRVTIEPFHPCNSGRVGSKMAPHMWNVVFIYSYYLLLHRDFWDSDPENSGNHKFWLYCYTHHAHSCIYRNRPISGYILVFLKIEVLYTKPLVSPPTVSQPSPSCWGMTMTPRPICWPCSLPTRRPTETVEGFATWIPWDGSGSKYKG